MSKIYLFALAFLLAVFCCPAARAGTARLITQGNRLYAREDYDGALAKYEKAKGLSPGLDIAAYDIGAALYKKGDYESAISATTEALSTEKKALEASASYNIGNSKYRLGTSRDDPDPGGAVKFLEESLDYYKRAIELDVSDEDAKFNYEFVNKKLEDLKNKQKQQQKEKNKPPEGDSEKEKEKKPEDKPEEKPEEKEEEKEKLKEEKEEERKPKPSTGGMSEEQAKMLLESHRHDEENKSEKKEKKGWHIPNVLKDW